MIYFFFPTAEVPQIDLGGSCRKENWGDCKATLSPGQPLFHSLSLGVKCEVSHEETCGEKANLPLFRTIPLDGRDTLMLAERCSSMLVRALPGSASSLFSSRLKQDQENLPCAIKTALEEKNLPMLLQLCGFQKMTVVLALAFSMKWSQMSYGKI